MVHSRSLTKQVWANAPLADVADYDGIAAGSQQDEPTRESHVAWALFVDAAERLRDT
jgi:hypothetical protein